MSWWKVVCVAEANTCDVSWRCSKFVTASYCSCSFSAKQSISIITQQNKGKKFPQPQHDMGVAFNGAELLKGELTKYGWFINWFQHEEKDISVSHPTPMLDRDYIVIFRSLQACFRSLCSCVHKSCLWTLKTLDLSFNLFFLLWYSFSCQTMSVFQNNF